MKKAIAFLLISSLLLTIATGLIFSNFAMANFEGTTPNITATPASPDPSSNDWPMFHFNAVHSGSPDNIAPTTHDLLWRFNTLNSSNPHPTSVSSSPAVVGNVIYVGSDDGIAYALNASSGSCIWSVKLGDFACSSPAIVNGVVYIEEWTGYIYALNSSTGATIWRSSTGYLGCCSPAVVDGILYTGSDHNGEIMAFNASDGAKLWSFPTISRAEAPPIVIDGIVYAISSNGNMYALNATTGECKWNSCTNSGNYVVSPAVYGGIVYSGANSSGYPSDNRFYALNASTGSELWSYPIGSNGYSSPAVIEGKVYVGTLAGKVFALNANTGSQVWVFQTGGYVKSSPAVAGGEVFVGSEDGKLYALNANTGVQLWSYDTGNAGISSSPAVVNGVVYIKNNDGYLYAFGKATNSSIDLFPKFSPTGSAVTLSGAGFSVGSTINATFGGSPISLSGATTVNSTGHFSATFNAAASPGRYDVVVRDTSGNIASTNFLVIAVSSVSWPMFMHDPQHTGTADDIPVSSHDLLWKFVVDIGDIMNAVDSSPAVVNGILYEGSQNGYLYALDAYTGTCYWRFNTGCSNLPSPVVVDGVVYMASLNGVYAVNAYTGQQIWKTIRTDSHVSTPVVSGGMLYVGSMVQHCVFAFRISDGQLMWQYSSRRLR